MVKSLDTACGRQHVTRRVEDAHPARWAG